MSAQTNGESSAFTDEQLLSEGKDLVEGGDLNLNAYKLAFNQLNNRPTTLTDDEAIIAIMRCQEDDWQDDETTVKAMLKAEDKS